MLDACASRLKQREGRRRGPGRMPVLQKLHIKDTQEKSMRRYRYPAPVAVALILAGTSATALADDAPKSAMTKFDELLDSAGLTVSGYVAASYYASNGYPFNVHQFDVDHNTFQLDQAGLQVAYQPK